MGRSEKDYLKGWGELMDDEIVIHSEDKEILLALYQEKLGVSMYAFHDKYLLSLGQIARVVRKYKAIGVFDLGEDILSLTTFGRSWLINNRLVLLQSKRELHWKKVPNKFKQEKLALDQATLPNIESLSRFFFEK